MARLALIVSWALGLLPLFPPLAALFPRELSRVGLVLLPWIALAGIPDVPTPPRSRAARERSRELALCLALLGPALAAAWALDRSLGHAGAGIAAGAGAGLVLGLAWARSSAAHGVHEARYALAWLIGVPGLALLAGVLAAAGSEAGYLGALARTSPLGWAWWRAAGGASPAGAVIVVVLLALAGGAFARGSRAAGSAS